MLEILRKLFFKIDREIYVMHPKMAQQICGNLRNAFIL